MEGTNRYAPRKLETYPIINKSAFLNSDYCYDVEMKRAIARTMSETPTSYRSSCGDAIG